MCASIRSLNRWYIGLIRKSVLDMINDAEISIGNAHNISAP